MERELGVRPPDRPSRQFPHLPDDLGELTDDGLMDLFAHLTQWASYMGVQVAKAEVDETDAESQARIEEAKVLVASWGGGRDDRVTLAKAERDTAVSVVEARQVFEAARAYRKMVATIYGNLEREGAAVSRELSRRIGMAPKEGRTARWKP